MPTERNRYYSAPPQIHNVAAQYGWDAAAQVTGAQGINTGAWASLQLNPQGALKVDMGGNVSISGVTIDQTPVVLAQSSGNAYLAAISGYTRFLQTGTISSSSSSYQVGITGTSAISGEVTSEQLVNAQSSGNLSLELILTNVATGFFTPSFNIVTSGQVQIPVGSKGYSIAVESGNAFVNGNLFISPISYNGGGYDKFSLGYEINVGCTGARAIIIWEI